MYLLPLFLWLSWLTAVSATQLEIAYDNDVCDLNAVFSILEQLRNTIFEVLLQLWNAIRPQLHRLVRTVLTLARDLALSERDAVLGLIQAHLHELTVFLFLLFLCLGILAVAVRVMFRALRFFYYLRHGSEADVDGTSTPTRGTGSQGALVSPSPTSPPTPLVPRTLPTVVSPVPAPVPPPEPAPVPPPEPAPVPPPVPAPVPPPVPAPVLPPAPVRPRPGLAAAGFLQRLRYTHNLPLDVISCIPTIPAGWSADRYEAAVRTCLPVLRTLPVPPDYPRGEEPIMATPRLTWNGYAIESYGDADYHRIIPNHARLAFGLSPEGTFDADDGDCPVTIAGINKQFKHIAFLGVRNGMFSARHFLAQFPDYCTKVLGTLRDNSQYSSATRIHSGAACAHVALDQVLNERMATFTPAELASALDGHLRIQDSRYRFHDRKLKKRRRLGPTPRY